MSGTRGFAKTDQSEELAALRNEAEEKAERYIEVEAVLEAAANRRDQEIARITRGFEEETRDLASERVELGNRLFVLTETLIAELNPGKRFVQLRKVNLAFKKGQPKVVIDDEEKAKRSIRSHRWATECLKVVTTIKKDAVKKKIKKTGKQVKGISIVEGQDFLYVNDQKVDLGTSNEPIAAEKSAKTEDPDDSGSGGSGVDVIMVG